MKKSMKSRIADYLHDLKKVTIPGSEVKFYSRELADKHTLGYCVNKVLLNQGIIKKLKPGVYTWISKGRLTDYFVNKVFENYQSHIQLLALKRKGKKARKKTVVEQEKKKPLLPETVLTNTPTTVQKSEGADRQVVRKILEIFEDSFTSLSRRLAELEKEFTTNTPRKINHSELSVRASKAILKAGIETDDVLSMKKRQLLKFENVGVGTINEITQYLEKRGLV
jgi:hypothetical protein